MGGVSGGCAGGEGTQHVDSAFISASQARPKPCPLSCHRRTERTFSNLCVCFLPELSLPCPPLPAEQGQGEGGRLVGWELPHVPPLLPEQLLVQLLNANYKRCDPNDLYFFFQQVLPAGP